MLHCSKFTALIERNGAWRCKRIPGPQFLEHNQYETNFKKNIYHALRSRTNRLRIRRTTTDNCSNLQEPPLINSARRGARIVGASIAAHTHRVQQAAGQSQISGKQIPARGYDGLTGEERERARGSALTCLRRASQDDASMAPASSPAPS